MPPSLAEINDWPLQVVKELVFRKMRYQAQQRIPLACLRDAQLEVQVDRCTQQLVLYLEASILAKDGKRVQAHARWPDGWWQAVREHWLPGWWLRRHPVRYNEIKIDEPTVRVCPHLPVPPGGGLHAHFCFLEERPWPTK